MTELEHVARREALLAWLAVLFVIVGFVGLWAWQTRRDQQTLLALPAAERAALYERTRETLRTVCVGAHEAPLGQFCSDQAELIVRLPECDAACRTLAESQLVHPVR